MELNPKDQRNINALADALVEIEEKQNKVYYHDFEKYQALFVTAMSEKLEKEEIIQLSTEFVRQFNPYKAIEIYDDDGKLLFKIPQLFITIKDVDPKYISAVNKFRGDGNSEIPRYAAEATQGLLVAILKSQQGDDNDGFASYRERVRHIAGEYQKDIQLFDKMKRGEGEGPVSNTKVVDTSDVAGVSWD